LVTREELYIKKIRNGTVIDHISPGHALDVLRILKIDGRGGQIVSVAINVESRREGKKDIVKVEGKELVPGEVDKIALIAPKATINIVRDFEVVEKKQVRLPQTIRGTVRCVNPSCISNAKEPIEPVLNVESIEPLRVKCHYCRRLMERQEVLEQF